MLSRNKLNASQGYVDSATQAYEKFVENSKEQQRQFDERNKVGIAMAQAKATQLAKNEKLAAVATLGKSINSLNDNLHDIHLLSQVKKEMSDNKQTSKAAVTFSGNNPSLKSIKFKHLEETNKYEEDDELRLLADKVDLASENLADFKDRNTSIEAYEEWLKEQKFHIALSAEPSSMMNLISSLDPYDAWKKKIQDSDLAIKQKLQQQLTDSYLHYSNSLLEARQAYFDRDIAYKRKVKFLTGRNNDIHNIMTDEEVCAYMESQFPSEEEFYEKLHHERVKYFFNNNPHPMAVSALERFEGRPANAKWQEIGHFYKQPLLSGSASLLNEQYARGVLAYLQSSGVKLDSIESFAIAGVKIGSRYAPASYKKLANLAASTADIVGCGDIVSSLTQSNIDKCVEKLWMYNRIYQEIIPREAGLDSDKLSVLYKMANKPLQAIIDNPEIKDKNIKKEAHQIVADNNEKMLAQELEILKYKLQASNSNQKFSIKG